MVSPPTKWVLCCTALSLGLCAAQGTVGWAVQGGAFGELASGNAISPDGLGGFCVTGKFTGTASFGSTNLTSTWIDRWGGYYATDAFVLHVTSARIIDWAVRVGGAGTTEGRGIAPDGSGGCVATGKFKDAITFGTTTLTANAYNHDVFVMRVTSAGVIDWVTQGGGLDGSTDVCGYGIVPDGLNGYFITGSTSGGTATFGNITLTSSGRNPWSNDVFVMHVKSAGVIDWAIREGGSGRIDNSGNIEYAIAPDGSGGCIVAGRFQGTATFGTFNLTSTGDYDVFVMRVTSTGAVGWALKAGGSYGDRDSVPSIAPDGSGGCFVTSTFYHPYGVGTAMFGSTNLTSNRTSRTDGWAAAFVMHVTNVGAIGWVVQTIDRPSGGGNPDSIASDGSGGCFVTGRLPYAATFGSTTLTGVSSGSAFVMHMTSAGVIDWAMKVRDAPRAGSALSVYGITPDGSGGFAITGSFRGMITVGSTNLTSISSSQYGRNAFVFNLAAPVLEPSAATATVDPVQQGSGPSPPTTTTAAVVQVEAGGSVRIRAGGTLEIGAIAAA